FGSVRSTVQIRAPRQILVNSSDPAGVFCFIPSQKRAGQTRGEPPPNLPRKQGRLVEFKPLPTTSPYKFTHARTSRAFWLRPRARPFQRESCRLTCDPVQQPAAQCN